MLLNYVQIKDLKPAMSEYLHDSLLLSDPSNIYNDKTVHDIRVLMKKLKAALKLAGPMLDKEAFLREYQAYREVGSILANWRETTVHRKLLKDIRKRYPKIMNPLADNEKIAQIIKKQEPDDETTAQITENFQKIHEILRKSSYRIRFMNLENPDVEKILIELEKCYDVTKEKYLIARNNPKPQNLHEFRKRAKDLMYQLFFFRPLKPSSVKSLEKRLDNITQNLGKFNDISFLKKYLGYKYPSVEKNPFMDELMIILYHEQEKHMFKTWPAAYRIFRPSATLMDLLGFSITAI